MDAIIVLFTSIVGSYFCNLDFCTIFTLVSIAIDLYKRYSKYTNDKMPNGR